MATVWQRAKSDRKVILSARRARSSGSAPSPSARIVLPPVMPKPGRCARCPCPSPRFVASYGASQGAPYFGIVQYRSWKKSSPGFPTRSGCPTFPAAIVQPHLQLQDDSRMALMCPFRLRTTLPLLYRRNRTLRTVIKMLIQLNHLASIQSFLRIPATSRSANHRPERDQLHRHRICTTDPEIATTPSTLQMVHAVHPRGDFTTGIEEATSLYFPVIKFIYEEICSIRKEG